MDIIRRLLGKNTLCQECGMLEVEILTSKKAKKPSHTHCSECLRLEKYIPKEKKSNFAEKPLRKRKNDQKT